MDKKTIIIISVIAVIIVILVAVMMGMEIKNNAKTVNESGEVVSKALTSDDIMRINGKIYSKEDFIKYIKYTLYKNDGEYNVDEEEYASQIENGTSIEDIFVSNTMNEYYQLKVYEILAEQKNITLSEDDITAIEDDYNSNSEKITTFGIEKEDYITIAKMEKIKSNISDNANDYIELPEEVFTSYVSQFSGDNAKSYTYRLIQVNYTTDSETESGEMVSGDMAEKRAYIDQIVANVKNGTPFEEAAESGDNRIIYSGSGIQFAKSMQEFSAGFLLDQKMGSQEMSDAAKKTPSGEMTEVIDTGSSFEVAKIEKVEEGIVGESEKEIKELLISNYADQLVGSVVKDTEINSSALSRIKIK